MMKTLFKALAFALILCFASCSTDDDGYVEVFDYNGNRLVPRTKVAAISDFTNMKTLLNLHNNCYCEAEGLQIKGGNKLYLGIATHIAGKSSGNRLATILEYDCSVE